MIEFRGIEPTQQKKCKRCGFVYRGDDIEIAFSKKIVRGIPLIFPTCKLCEQDKRTKIVRSNRWRAKIRSTIKAHAKKFGISQIDLQEKHGWNIDQMSHDAEFQYQNGCPECHDQFKIMGNGLADITLDIWDPRIEPGYGSNTKWMCRTCNQAKGDRTPEEWTRTKRLHRERNIYLTRQAMMPKPQQLSLFTG